MLKKMMFGKIIVLLLLVATVHAFGFQDEGTVRIGSIEAQTGIPAPYGTQALNGSKIAIDEINAAGGVLIDGKKVMLQLTPSPNGYDPGHDSAITLALMKKLIFDDHVLLIKGTSRSQNTEVAFNYLNEMASQGTPIILLSSCSASPGLGKITKWGFRNGFFEGQVLEREMEILNGKFGYRTAGIYVIKDNPFCVALANVMKSLSKKHGIEVKVEVDGLEKDTELSTQVEALKKENVDVVLVSATTKGTISLMQETARRGFKPRIWIGTISNIAPEMPKIGGKGVERMIMGSSFAPELLQVKKLADEYQRRFRTEINLFGVNGHEAMYLFRAAIEKAEIKNTRESLQEDRRKIRDALTKVEITSVTGEKVRFNEENDAVKKGFIITIREGKYQVWDEKEFK